MSMKRHSFFLSDELKRRLEEVAARTGTPASEHIRAAIDLYCDYKQLPRLDNPPPRGTMKAYEP